MTGGLKDLVAKLRLDTTDFSRGLRSSSQSVKAVAAAMAAATVALGTALSAAAMRGAREIDVAAKAARRLDGTVAGYRALEMAADDAGVSLSSLANDVQSMNRELARAAGGKGAAGDALKKLGLAASDFAGLDADQRVAILADRVKALGLDSGQTTLLLRDLGIKNREMALLVMQGGDALRAARTDVDQFGLAISQVDAARIEAANDEISGLADITTYFSDQLALKLVPSLGQMAKGMTDSLREGGLLRTLIDGFIGSLDVLAASLAVATTGFGVYYVGAMVRANLATLTLAGSLVTLRTALMRTGIGALIIGAGYLVAKFVDLVQGTGSFGASLGLLKDVAVEVWDRIGNGVSFVTNSVAAMSAQIDGFFISALRRMAGAWVDFTWAIADGLNSLFGSNLQGASAVITQELSASERAANAAAASYTAAASAAGAAFKAPLQSIAALNAAVDGTTTSLEGANDAADGLGDAVESAGGKGSAAAAKVKEAVDKVAQAADKGADRLGNMFASLLDGSKSVKSAVAELIMELAKMQLMKGFRSLFGSGGPLSGIGAALGLSLNANGNVFSGGRIQAFAKGGVVAGATAFAMQGGLGVMGEAGPEAIMPLSRGADGKLGVRSAAGGGALKVTITMDPSTATLQAFVKDQAGRVVAQSAPAIAGAAVQQVVALGRENRIF